MSMEVTATFYTFKNSIHVTVILQLYPMKQIYIMKTNNTSLNYRYGII